MKRIIYISLVFLFTEINAQQDFIMYHMPSIPQITQVDPASFPDSKFDIGLPIISSVYGSIFNTGFSGSTFAKSRFVGNRTSPEV